MAERASRPLNQAACAAADDDIYSKHEDDPRPNALYDEDGNRKPLDPNDPDQAGLRTEWMDSYKANGGATEPMNGTGGKPGQVSQGCDDRPMVNPVIFATMLDLDDSGGEDGDDQDAAADPDADAASATDNSDDSADSGEDAA